MKNLNTCIYDNQNASIKDLMGDIDISAFKWNSLFQFLVDAFDTIYFHGERKCVRDDEFEQTVSFLSQDTLNGDQKEHRDIFFRTKKIFLSNNRGLAKKLWQYYDHSAFIFLGDENDDKLFREVYLKNTLFDNIIGKIDNVFILSRYFEPDVLWIKSNIDFKPILAHFLV